MKHMHKFKHAPKINFYPLTSFTPCMGMRSNYHTVPYFMASILYSPPLKTLYGFPIPVPKAASRHTIL